MSLQKPKLRTVLIVVGTIALFWGAITQWQVTPQAGFEFGTLKITDIDPLAAVCLYIGTLWFLTGISLHVKGK